MSEPINILPTFIHQLAVHFPPFQTIVAKHLRDDSKLTPESMKGSLFLDFICSLPSHPEHTLVFVIDALDKCGNAKSRPRILKVLTNATAQAPWLKIIVTSRTEVDIQHFFDSLTQLCMYHMTWPQIKVPVMICESSPKASSIQWPLFGISVLHGPKNRISTESFLRQTVCSSTLRLLFMPLNTTRTLRSR